MAHNSLLIWSYLILLGGIAVLLAGVLITLWGSHSSRSALEDETFKRRMESLDSLRRAGQISRDDYNRRRTELLVEHYKRQVG